MSPWNDKNVDSMTGYGKVKIKEYHPSVWTGKNMAKYIERIIRHDPNFVIRIGDKARRGLHVTDSVFEEQIQPNGIDLTVDKVFQQTIGPTLTRDKQFIDPGFLVEQTPDDLAGLPDDSKGWFLEASYYLVEWAEMIEIPKNAIGLIFPRSTLLRLGGTICTAVWDRGYCGKGRSGLFLGGIPMLLEHGTRLGQMIFIDAQEDEQLYDGQYQGENIPTVD